MAQGSQDAGGESPAVRAGSACRPVVHVAAHAASIGWRPTSSITRALEHGAPPVDIRTARSDGHWVISVRDHGAGIPDDRIAAAMKPFVRLDAARGGEGHCGLGLAIVARLAHDRGADVATCAITPRVGWKCVLSCRWGWWRCRVDIDMTGGLVVAVADP